MSEIETKKIKVRFKGTLRKNGPSKLQELVVTVPKEYTLDEAKAATMKAAKLDALEIFEFIQG